MKTLKERKEMQDMDHTREEFLTQPLGRLLSKHTVPAIVSMLFMAMHQVIDGIMVGRSLGPDAMASVNILYPVVALLAGLGLMIAVGGNARIAVLLGAGQNHQASRLLGLVVSLGAGVGIAGSLASIVFMPQILNVLGTSGEMGRFAAEYLRGLLPFFVFMILIVTLVQSVRNDGQPGLASGVMIVCALANIGLDYLFLFVYEMGIAGAALATGLSQTMGALVFLAYFLKKTLAQRPGLVLALPEFSRVNAQAVVVNGSSEFFNSLAAGVTTFLFNHQILAHVGPLGVAAFTLVQYILMIGMFVVTGIGSGAQPVFSYNHGAGLQHRVRGALWRVSGLSTLVGAAIFGVMSWQTPLLAGLFLPDNPEALMVTLEVADLVRWSMLFMPLAMLGSIYFTAIEQAASSLLVALVRGFVIPVLGLMILPGLWGPAGIWITPLLAEGLAVLVAAGCLFWPKGALRFGKTPPEPAAAGSLPVSLL